MKPQSHQRLTAIAMLVLLLASLLLARAAGAQPSSKPIPPGTNRMLTINAAAPQTSPVDMGLRFMPGAIVPGSSHDIQFDMTSVVTATITHSEVNPNDDCTDASTHPLLPSHSTLLHPGSPTAHAASPYFYTGANNRQCWYQTSGEFWPGNQPKHVYVAAAGIVPSYDRPVDLRGTAELIAIDKFQAGDSALLRVHGSTNALVPYTFSGVTSPCATNLPYSVTTEPVIGFNWNTPITLTASMERCPFEFTFTIPDGNGGTLNTKTILYADVAPSDEPAPMPTGWAAFTNSAPVKSGELREIKATVLSRTQPVGLSEFTITSPCITGVEFNPPSTSPATLHEIYIQAQMAETSINRNCAWEVTTRIVGGDHDGQILALNTSSFVLHATEVITQNYRVMLPMARR